MKTCWVLGMCLVAVSAMGCKKGDSAGGGDTAEDGCGKDFADPGKQFCVTVPKDWTAKTRDPGTMYSEIVDIGGKDPQDGISVTTGKKKYEEDLAFSEKIVAGKKGLTSGATPGNNGKWWSYNDGRAWNQSTAKAANGMAVNCVPNNSIPNPGSLEVCKTIRPYPTKK